MASMKLLLILPIFASARIHIDIQASNDYGHTRVYMSGYSKDLITDKDREIFKIRDWELKEAAYMHSGGRPDDVYVRSPTPLRWGDLYSELGWKEITRKIKPKSSRILGISNENVVVARKHFNNKSRWSSGYGGSLSQQADMTVRNTWSSGGSYNFGEQVHYSVSIGPGSIGKTRSVSYSKWFGTEQSQSSGISIGSDISVHPSLGAGQSVDVVLTAKRSVVTVEITYEASLHGTVACNYSGRYKGHYFWAYSVNLCLEAVGKPRKILMKEEIQVGFYFDEDVTST